MPREAITRPAAGDAPVDKVQQIEIEIKNDNIDQVVKGVKNQQTTNQQIIIMNADFVDITNEEGELSTDDEIKLQGYDNNVEQGKYENQTQEVITEKKKQKGKKDKDEYENKAKNETQEKRGSKKRIKDTRDTIVETDIHEVGRKKAFDRYNKKAKGDAKKERGKSADTKNRNKKKKYDSGYSNLDKDLEKELEKYGADDAEEAEVEDVGVAVTPEKIAREYAYRRAEEVKKARQLEKKQRQDDICCSWPPPVCKPPLKTKPWMPPGPPERPPKVVLELPKLKTQPWTPPWMLERQRRQKLPRMLIQDIQPMIPYEGSLLKKIWHSFSQVEPNKMMLQGTLACNSKRYSPHHRGMQTACIALVCRALLDEKTPAQLTRRDVDDVIEAADAYYKRCVKSMKCYKGKSNLELKQLLLKFFFRETKYEFDLEEAGSGVLAVTGEELRKPKEERPPDLLAFMEKQVGLNYMFVLSVDKCKHFLIWGHPPLRETNQVYNDVQAKIKSQSDVQSIGSKTNSQIKDELIDSQLKELIDNQVKIDSFKIKSQRTKNEIKTNIQTNSETEVGSNTITSHMIRTSPQTFGQPHRHVNIDYHTTDSQKPSVLMKPTRQHKPATKNYPVSEVKTVCYIFDPHMLDEFGNRSLVHGAGAFLRYPGVNSFVVDFLVNHSKIHKMATPMSKITLTLVEILKKEPMWRTPGYKINLNMLKAHCKSEWEAMNINAMIDEKLYKGKWALASMSAESVAMSRRSSRKKVRDILGVPQPKPSSPPPQLPVLPPKSPPPPPVDILEKYKGQEDFFLQCPRIDGHLYGRDDLLPLADSEPKIHSQYILAEETYPSQFHRLDEGKSILRATRHFATKRYELFKSYTGVACCIAALAMLKKRRAKAWNEDSLDETFDVGWNLFRDSLEVRHGPIRRLVLGELTNTFKMRNRQYKFKKRNIVVWGRLQSTNSKIFDLCRALEAFFREADSGILQIPGELETAIWYEDKKYYLYHPWPADEIGTRVSLQGGGKGCLLCFTSIARLCKDFIENTKDLKRKPFCISDVTVWDLGQLPDPVNSMKPIDKNRWIVRGGFHEGDERFPAKQRNKQATPMCIIAIAWASLVEPDVWSQQDVDETLVRGDNLYEKTMENLYKLGIVVDEQLPPEEEEEAENKEFSAKPSRMVSARESLVETPENEAMEAGLAVTLAAADVLHRFNLTPEDSVEVEVQDSAFPGVLYPEPGSGLMSLEEALSAMFKDNMAAVVTARDASMAVWKRDEYLYFYDPHGCDENGLPSNDIQATACLIRMKYNVKELADVIMGNLAPGVDDSFNLSPVEIIKTKIDPITGAPEIKKEGKAFEWLNRGTATILMGPRGENTAIGQAAKRCGVPSDDLAGRLIALPVVAAFCSATEAVPPTGMHQEHIFNFLEAGGEYYLKHVEATGRKDIQVEDLSERFAMGVNTFSIEVGQPITLPLRLPDPVPAEGGAEEEEEEPTETAQAEEENSDNKEEPLKEMKEQLYKMWYDLSKPQTVSILCGDYHQLGLWMTAGGKLVVFDPAPTLAKGALTESRIIKGDELRKQRILEQKEAASDAETEAEDEEPGAEEEAVPEPAPVFVPPESCPVLMVFSSPGEFIDKLVFKGGLDPVQAVAPYSLYPVTVITELTSMVKPKRKPKHRETTDKQQSTIDLDQMSEEEPEIEVPLPPALADEALGKHFERKTRTTASLRGRIAQDEAYFMDVPNRDNQDAAISVMAMIVHNIEPYHLWKPSLVDVILKYGDRLYTLSTPFAHNPPRLAANEIIKEFRVTSFIVKLEVTPDVAMGDYKAEESSELMTLRKGLKKFFEKEAFGVICAKNYCAGVWRAQDNNAWVYWDPHPVGPTGKLSPASAAGVVLFSTLEELADTFKINLNNLGRPGTNNYSIASVHVSWKFADIADMMAEPLTLHGTVPEGGYEWKVLTAYVEIGRGRTILRGCRPRDILRFTRDTLIWSSSSAIIAVAMATMRAPQLWTVKTIDEIITNGCHLFKRSLMNLGYEFRPGEDILHPLQVSRDFVLGSNYIRYDLQAIYSGILEGRVHNIVTTELGLDRFFKLYTHGILWSAPYAVAIWKLADKPAYYMMEPHACGPTGMRTDAQEDAAACVMTFYSPSLMTHAYLMNLPRVCRPSHHFTLYAMRVNVIPVKPFKRDPPLVKPPNVPATSRVDITGKRRDLVLRRDLATRPSEDSELLDEQELDAQHEEDDPQLKGLRNTNGWLVLLDKSQFLSASHSMSCKRYPYTCRGNQALAMCVMAIATSAAEEVCRWCNKTLNQVLDSGNMLYEDSYLYYKPMDTPILGIDQILRKFYTPGNCVCRVVVYQPRQIGDITSDCTNHLRQFFREEDKGVFVAHGGKYAVALFKTQRGYYMFDPGDCDRYGREVPPFLRGKARACLSKYPNVQLLADKLKGNVPFQLKGAEPEQFPLLRRSSSIVSIENKDTRKSKEDEKLKTVSTALITDKKTDGTSKTTLVERPEDKKQEKRLSITEKARASIDKAKTSKEALITDKKADETPTDKKEEVKDKTAPLESGTDKKTDGTSKTTLVERPEDKKQEKKLSITEKVRTSIDKAKSSIRESIDKTKAVKEKKSSQVHFSSIDNLFMHEKKQEKKPTDEGQYAIYGMEVTNLRKLNRYEM